MDGDRIEVKVLEENGITSDVWWGASYRGESASSSGYSTLLYDARGSGFSECTSTVIMLGAHELIDVAEGSKLRWRKEGDKWLDEESIHMSDSLRRAGPSFSMQDLLQDQQRPDATEHHGVSVEQVGMAAFAELPSTKQHTLAMDSGISRRNSRRGSRISSKSGAPITS